MKFSLYIIIIHTGRLYHVDYSKLGAVLIRVANTLATANDRERELGTLRPRWVRSAINVPDMTELSTISYDMK